ncbi:MAG: DUF2070 family protein, partial [Salinirussus sp.]
WLPLGVIFVNNLEVLVISSGLDQFHRVAAASLVQPLGMLAGITWLIPAFGDSSRFVEGFIVLTTVAVGLWVASAFVEWLVDANIQSVDGLEITSRLVQRAPLELDLGSSEQPTVQNLAIETADGTVRLAAPWIHPGILEQIGGGRLTRQTIQALERRGSGFFLHVPCSHRSNSADPDVHQQVLDGLEPTDSHERASQMYSRRLEDTTFHGRRYGDRRVVFIESDAYGDYEIGVFAPVIDADRTLIVDRHVRADDRERTFVSADSAAADRLRDALSSFLEELDEAPLSTYRAGYAVDPDISDGGISLFALVEEVDDQRILILGADQNENPTALLSVADDHEDAFDEILPFTTDTHASVAVERFDPQPALKRVQSVVQAAEGSVEEAAAGLSAGTASETRILGQDYDRLLHTLNIGARVYIVLLGVMYLVLLAGILTVVS